MSNAEDASSTCMYDNVAVPSPCIEIYSPRFTRTENFGNIFYYIGRKSPARARGTGNRAGIERAAGVARRTPAPRPPLCVDRVRLPNNIRSSSRVNRFESSHRGVAVESTNSPRVPLNSFSSPSPLDARALVVATSRFSFVRLDGRGAQLHEL